MKILLIFVFTNLIIGCGEGNFFKLKNNAISEVAFFDSILTCCSNIKILPKSYPLFFLSQSEKIRRYPLKNVRVHKYNHNNRSIIVEDSIIFPFKVVIDSNFKESKESLFFENAIGLSEDRLIPMYEYTIDTDQQVEFEYSKSEKITYFEDELIYLPYSNRGCNGQYCLINRFLLLDPKTKKVFFFDFFGSHIFGDINDDKKIDISYIEKNSHHSEQYFYNWRNTFIKGESYLIEMQSITLENQEKWMPLTDENQKPYYLIFRSKYLITLNYNIDSLLDTNISKHWLRRICKH